MVEQILQTGTEQVDDQDVVQALLAEVVDIRDPSCNMSVESVLLLMSMFVGRQPYTARRRHCIKQMTATSTVLRTGAALICIVACGVFV